jgi:hypothetical protein
MGKSDKYIISGPGLKSEGTGQGISLKRNGSGRTGTAGDRPRREKTG